MPNIDGYRNNGFFNVDMGPSGEGVRDGGVTNSQFMYPTNDIRFLAAQEALTNRGVTPVIFPPYKIQRGFIRNLRQPSLGDTPINKCNFQFNPQDIRQSVQMREDMYLAVLQDPAQLAQPIGAQMNFQFDLLFDRQMEVARGEGGVDTGGSLTSADQIGVLADLQVLYTVIGQGLSKNMVDSQLKGIQNNATRVYGNANPAAEEDPGTTADTTTPPAAEFSAYDPASVQNANEFQSMNDGNAAFLMPNPVRLMFSSLFMLDGFITGTNVDFLKFSTKMVPVTCKVSVSMMAVYIGFARTDTFLTHQFAAARDAEEDAIREDEEGSRELIAALKTTANSVTLGFSRGDSIDNFTTSYGTPINYAVMKNPGTFVADDGDIVNYKDNFIVRFDSVKPKKGSGSDTDDILKLFENDTQFTVGYNWQCKIYGTSGVNGWSTKAAATAVLTTAGGADALTKGLSEEVLTNLDDAANTSLAGYYQGSKSASSKDEWGRGEKRGARRLVIEGERGSKSELTNGASAAKKNVLGQGYYIVVWQFEVTGIVTGLQEHKRPAPSAQYIAQIKYATDKLYVNYNLNWTESE